MSRRLRPPRWFLYACLVPWACDHESAPPPQPAAATTTHRAAKQPTKRLAIDPGGPLAATRVAQIARKRLAQLDIPGRAVSIGAHHITVTVNTNRVEEARASLAGGRFDLYRFDETQDPFRDHERAKQERVSHPKREPHTLSYVVGSRDEVLALVSEQSTSALGLIGPMPGKQAQARALGLTGRMPGSQEQARYRSYFVEREGSIRGEHIARARAITEAEGPQLALTFNGDAINKLRWASKRGRRFVAYANGEVISTRQPKELIDDGTLQFSLPTIERARKLAKALDGRAFSHRVKRVSELGQ